jgi:hypothetical protein
MKTSVYDVQEDKLPPLESLPWDAEKVRLLWSKKVLQARQRVEYWAPYIQRGHKYFNYYNGKILDDRTREIYEDVEDKIVIEPRLMRAPLRALHGQAIRAIRSGSVTTEGGTLDAPSAVAEEVAVMNAVLKHMETESKERERIGDAVHDAYVSCMPNVLYWEKVGPDTRGSVKGYRLTHLPWDSCCLGPITFREVDGSDVQDMVFFDWRSKAQLLMNFPDMKDQIEAHYTNLETTDAQALTSLDMWEGMLNAEDRNTIHSITRQALDGVKNGAAGMVPVFQHLFPIRRNEDVWINIESDNESDYVMRPDEWDEGRWEQWVEANPQYLGPVEKPCVTLWATVWTDSGLVLSNRRHWFQNHGQLPIGVIIPAMIGGVPSGPADDMADATLSKCIGEIEYLDEVRKNSGRLFASVSGAIKNASDFTSEASRSIGYLELDGQVVQQFGGIQNTLHEFVRSPNPAFKHWGDNQKAELYEMTRINETMQGQAAPRQSDVAKQTEIAQALIVNSIYMLSVNRGNEAYQNLKLKLVPYIYSQEDYIEIADEETGEEIPMPINQPTEFDEQGNPTEILNDLTAHNFKWRMSMVDDSDTAKQRQMQEAMLIINQVGGPLLSSDPTGRFFADFLQAMPNQMLKDAGRRLREDIGASQQAQSQAQQAQVLQEAKEHMAKMLSDFTKANKAGNYLSITARDLAEFPQLQEFYMQLQNRAAQETAAQMQAVEGMGAQNEEPIPGEAA